MPLATRRRYVEAMGGTLELVAYYPNRPLVVIDHLAPTSTARGEPGANAGGGMSMRFHCGHGQACWGAIHSQGIV